MKIVGLRNKEDMDVEFQDEYKFVNEHITYQAFKKGQVRNPYDKSIYGVACFGVGKYRTNDENDKTSEEYHTWGDMIRRCYSEDGKKRYPAYYHICSVCDEWLNYQVFAEWFNENKYPVEGRLHLDKDILFPGNKIYSPKTCLLVPQRINMLFMNLPNNTGLPNGIRLTTNGRYNANYGGKSLGTYDTIEEAYVHYAERKEKVIKEVADEYKDIIPLRVYEALYDYKVDIHHDKNYAA